MAKIPNIDAPQETGALGWLRAWLDRARLWIMTRDPASPTVGDPLDKFVTRGELVGQGLLTRASDGSFRGAALGGTTTVIVDGGGGGGESETPDLTPPPMPSGASLTAGITYVYVAFAAPSYTTGHGNAFTRIYGAIWQAGDAEPTFNDPRTKLVEQAAEQAAFAAIPSNPDTRWCIWLTHYSRDGVESSVPSGGAHGHQATTGQDVTALLQVLTGQIRSTQLHSTLGSRIDLIDGPASLSGSVAARIQVEANDRAAAILAEAQTRGTAISSLQTSMQQTDFALSNSIANLSATVNTDRANAAAAVANEATARSAGDAAEASARQTLASQLRGAYTGTDLSQVTTGLIFSERQARTSADSALATRADALEASVNTPSTGLLARATALESITTNVTSGNAALASRTSALESSVNNATTGLSATRALLLSDYSTTASMNGAIVSQANTLRAEFAAADSATLASANAYTVANAYAKADGTALASTVTTLSATVAGNTSAIQQASTVTAALDGSVQALYTLRAEVSAGGRTVVGGYGLAATSTAAGGSRIDFGVRADRFFVDAPAGSGVTARVVPFVVATTSFTEGGVTRPAGVYMDAAFIRNLTAVYATIQALVADQITAASISVGQLTAGSLNVGSYIQSGGFTSGSGATPGVGFRISGNGSAEFNNVTARGTIYATAGAIGGNVLGADYMQSSNFSSGSSGWRLKSDGSAEFGAAAIRGQLTVQQIQIGGIVAGSGNILRNGDFLRFAGAVPDGFGIYNDAGVTVLSGPSPGFVANSNWCFLQCLTGTASSFGMFGDAVVGFGGFKQAATYIISWYAQVIADNGPANAKGLIGKTMQMAWAVAPEAFEMIVNPPLSTLPQRYIARVRWGYGPVDSQFRISKLIDGSSTSAGDVLYIGAMQVEMGETPSGWAPAPVSTLNKITAENAGSYFSVGTLSALAVNTGQLTVDSNGFVRGGQTDWASGDGFFLGRSGGAYKFSIGTSSNFMRWSPGSGLELSVPDAGLSLASFTATMPAGNLTVSVGAGPQTYGSRSVSVSGGKAPYTYFWSVDSFAAGVLAGQGTATATFSGWGNGATITSAAICLVRDANGRVTMASCLIHATHAYDAGGGGPGGEGGEGGGV